MAEVRKVKPADDKPADDKPADQKTTTNTAETATGRSKPIPPSESIEPVVIVEDDKATDPTVTPDIKKAADKRAAAASAATGEAKPTGGMVEALLAERRGYTQRARANR
jgi:hypothetical protein